MIDIDIDDMEIPGGPEAVIDIDDEKTYPVQFGTFYDMSNARYHAIDGVSSTQFSKMRKSMAVFENRRHFKEDSAAFAFGNLLHTAVLEPHKLNEYIEAGTVGVDTSDADYLRKVNPGKIVVGKGSIDMAKDMAHKVHLIYGDFIRLAHKEVSIIHDARKETGLIYKIRPDIMLPRNKIILDLKSTTAETPSEFEKTIEKYDYDLSAAWYLDVARMEGNDIRTFGWIAAPKTGDRAPFGFQASDELIEKGRAKYGDLLKKYIEYKESGADELFKIAHSWEFIREMQG